MIGVLRLRMPDGSIQTVTAIKGDKGDKPTKGVDYFTDEDKAEMVNEVLAALPNGDEVRY